MYAYHDSIITAVRTCPLIACCYFRHNVMSISAFCRHRHSLAESMCGRAQLPVVPCLSHCAFTLAVLFCCAVIVMTTVMSCSCCAQSHSIFLMYGAVALVCIIITEVKSKNLFGAVFVRSDTGEKVSASAIVVAQVQPLALL